VEHEIIVVGTSWGGLSALNQLIAGLQRNFGIPVVAVQHRHRQSGAMLAALLQDRTALGVYEVEDKAPIVAGNIYVAPPDYHLLIEPGYFSLSTDEPVRYSRPSIDVTFVSAADTYGAKSVGVVLTGANADGSRGLKRIFDRGGKAFVQSPATAESPTMPTAAIRCVPQALVMTIDEIAAELAKLGSKMEAPRTRARAGQ
jgi:two-component system, chemotaxis family, protein-glutamate methylesterase/glutaminase